MADRSVAPGVGPPRPLSEGRSLHTQLLGSVLLVWSIWAALNVLSYCGFCLLLKHRLSIAILYLLSTNVMTNKANKGFHIRISYNTHFVEHQETVHIVRANCTWVLLICTAVIMDTETLVNKYKVTYKSKRAALAESNISGSSVSLVYHIILLLQCSPSRTNLNQTDEHHLHWGLIKNV